MASMLVLYTTPDDAAGFDEHYRTTHIPLCQAVPGVSSTHISRITGTPRGGDAPYYLTAELRFSDGKTMGEAMRTDEMMEVSKDAMGMCKQYGTEATILLAEDF